MSKKIIKYIKFLMTQKNKASISKYRYSPNTSNLSKVLDENILNFKNILGKSDDIIFREFFFGVKKQTKAFICYVDGLGDKNYIIEDIVKPLMVNIHITDPNGKIVDMNNLFNDLKEHILNIVEAKEVSTFDEATYEVLSGNTLLLLDGSLLGISIGAKGGERRSVSQPETEVVIRGPKESFVETLRINTSLLRRIIKSPNLVFETQVVGRITRTDVCIAYIDGIADKNVVQEVRDRIKKIDIDSILESGYIEQLIEDYPFSPFSTVGNSERPDKISAKLLEGRVAILCNGTPVVLTVPYLFVEAFQVPEDYYSRPILSNLIRLLRLLGFLITLLLPSLYISLETYHQEMVPTVLLISFAAAREDIPFPIFIETLISETIFQLLRESGIRMPRAVGSAVSIVGTLVIGEAAVNAGIIGAPMVIVTALSAITSFVIPSMYDAIIVFRIILIFLSGAFGLYGVLIGLLCMLAHMCSLKSFGKPFMSPMAPMIWSDIKDSIIRFPLFFMKFRPKAITKKTSKRHSDT